MKRVLFLFNHDAPHQVAHLAGTAASFASTYPQMRTVIAHAGTRIRQAVEQFVPPDAAERIEWAELRLPPIAAAATGILDRVLPASRLYRLRAHLSLFASVDAVVSTERTCLRLKRHLPPGRMPAFVRMPHGAGDRSVTYHPDYRRFDLVLASGRKTFNELVRREVAAERIRIVGYPKFDTIDVSAKPRFFADERPVVVYNPHFDPHLSSWYDHGPDLLRWFAGGAGQRFSLIFAPHVMLFRKKLHISPEYRVARVRPDIPAEVRSASNILIDTDSPRLFDMSYMLAADAYIGDVSSQIYEFLARPRAAFFLAGRGGADEEGHLFRQAGPVFEGLDDLTRALSDWRQIGAAHRKAQEDLFDETFSRDGQPANLRAAQAIADFVVQRGAGDA